MGIKGKLLWAIVFFCGVAFFATVPHTGFKTTTYFFLMIKYICLALSFNLIAGYVGYISFGHVAFFGIGGGIIIEGKLYQGVSGAAGEPGHMTVDESGPACGCGNTGCLEMLASGRAIARETIERINAGEKSVLTGNITAEKVVNAAKEGDALAKEVIARAGHYLGVGLVNTVNIFNPEMIVIGGGMAEIGEMLLGPARELVNKRAFGISARAVEIVTAKLGNEAGVYGAAVYARDKIIRRTA